MTHWYEALAAVAVVAIPLLLAGWLLGRNPDGCRQPHRRRPPEAPPR